jgi:shikimate kinase
MSTALSTPLMTAPSTTITDSTCGSIELAAMPAALPGNVSRIVLTGFMGAGKTTVGRQLAAALGWEFVDLDTFIEQRTGLTVPQIFAEKGEAAFRRLESVALAAALGRRNIVLALGGGTPEQITNRLLLEQTPRTLTVYLHAPLEVLTARCLAQQSGTERPVLANKTEVAQRFAARLPHYRRLAAVTIDTATASIQDTAALLHESIKSLQ